MTAIAPYKQTICIAALIAFVCLTAPVSHAASTLLIKGVGGELAQNIRLLVAAPPAKEEERKFKRYIDSLPAQVVTAMSAYGYYAAEASVSVTDIPVPKPKKAVGRAAEIAELKGFSAAQTADPSPITQITIDVVRNAPVRIRNLELQIIDLVQDNDDFTNVADEAKEKLAVGNVFVSGDYESAKSSLLSTAQELGYFDFEFTQSAVRVSRKAGTADITISVKAGERFSFGDILFKQQTFSDTFMNRWAPFEEGDLYDAALIGELTQNLQSSGYFSGVRVRPLVDPRYEQTVPIIVELTQRDQNQVAVGVGFSSDTQLRTKLTWGKPLLNSNGHSAEFGVSLSRDVQSASFSYRIPRSKEPLFNYWGIEYGVRAEEKSEGDVKSFLSTLNFQRARRTENDWTESLFIRWERERTKVAGIEEETDLVLPGFSYSRSQSEGEPFPTRGQSLSFQLMGGAEKLLSSINFLKSVARFRYLRAVSDRNTLIATAQYGVIKSNDYDKVPGTQRFFAGGDRTVRGFAYQSISPRNDDGDAVGGRFLEVVNAEYNYRFRDRWSGALFIDAGRAFNQYSAIGYSVGAGFGVRWQSPVGPFRIDIARPVSDNDGDGIRVHLSLGPDL